MPHWKFTLAYHGASFHGWQIQPGLPTVQGTLAEALRRLTGEHVLPQGAGRTDAGVHALAQVASCTLAAPLPRVNLLRALNRALPPTVRIMELEEVSPAFHARHSARGKRYEYRVFERRLQSFPAAQAVERPCSPFLAPFVWDCRWPLDLARLQAAAACLPGTRDFSAMAAKSRDYAPTEPVDGGEEHDHQGAVNPVRTIFSAEWYREADLLYFRVHGSGFLHHMVRNLVGTMVDMGRGSLAVADFERILRSRDRAQAGPTAPPQGLYLAEVLYAPPPVSELLEERQLELHR